ncbi:WW domain-binding protein 4-like [Stegodyphus dumicola]|uniref:WW domain-binding protein 4-like n=1 Tax=Stegodyphus dumicola TaxID=202533 RepID=UPI0015A91E55|nr:WW domain-binding protein 4-like [Stegodyphus dumicola]
MYYFCGIHFKILLKIQKKGLKEYKKQKELEDEMDKIEKAALEAYEKDLQRSSMQQKSNLQQNSESLNKQISVVEQKANIEKVINAALKKQERTCPENKTELSETSSRKWYEAMTDEGYRYYWNIETSESRWDPPEESYVVLEEQGIQNAESKEADKENPEDTSSLQNEENKDSNDTSSFAIGPQPRIDPYGQWVTVEHKKPVQYDLELPKLPENYIEVAIPVVKDEEPRLKFKEKTIGQLSDMDSNEEVTFKKRKFNSSCKKNARQRTVDDD